MQKKWPYGFLAGDPVCFSALFAWILVFYALVASNDSGVCCGVIALEMLFVLDRRSDYASLTRMDHRLMRRSYARGWRSISSTPVEKVRRLHWSPDCWRLFELFYRHWLSNCWILLATFWIPAHARWGLKFVDFYFSCGDSV
ncbi:MAG: hypothetical protein U5K79_05310 [Cyclobacteriaceae bacterium]|nr:hypothetical protein [Cyclobacteriaceae bacterium]